MDPIGSKVRVVAATEFQWKNPDEHPEDSGNRSLTKLLENFPRDVCLICSTPSESPSTKNELSQLFIRKGYWVALKSVDEQTAVELLRSLTGWADEEMISKVVRSVGTSPSDLISFLKMMRHAGVYGDDEGMEQYLTTRPQGGVFELVDSVVMKDLPKALRLCSDDVPAGQLAGALDRKFTSLLQFMGEMKKGRSPKEASIILRLPGFLVHGLYEASKRWTGPEIVSLYPAMAHHTLHSNRPGSNEVLVRGIIGS